jgi:RND family efflux transporter MFP subunit
MSAKPSRWLIIFPLIIGIASVFVLLKNRSEPQQAALTEPAKPVRFIRVPELDVVPHATGYGSVEPGKTWDAVAEVTGRIIETYPQLKNGELIKADSVILRIDPSDYELALAQVDTDIQGVQAQLAELDAREINTRASLEIEQQALALNGKELERNRALADKGTVTRSAFEQEQRAVLAQRQNVQSLQNTLNLLPAEHALLEAQLARQQAQRRSAQLNLERTTIKAPFAGRIATVNIEQSQYVRQGEVLVSIDGIDVAEISVRLPMSRLRPLIQPDPQRVPDLDSEAARRLLGFTATVRLPALDLPVSWEARFVRVGDAVDSRTRTLGIVVAVDEPYRQSQPGLRPPLVKGMFAEVELRGKARPHSLVIPRVALQGNRVYLIDEADRLLRRQVEITLLQSGYAVIGSGLEAGDRVVVSVPVPAIDGMLLQPVADDDLLEEIRRDAGGVAP